MFYSMKLIARLEQTQWRQRDILLRVKIARFYR